MRFRTTEYLLAYYCSSLLELGGCRVQQGKPVYEFWLDIGKLIVLCDCELFRMANRLAIGHQFVGEFESTLPVWPPLSTEVVCSACRSEDPVAI